jgi:predicted RNase H-like HicB family nuclease
MGGYQLTAIIEREGSLFVARCLELDIASHGGSGTAALVNLKAAVATFLENSQDAELSRRLARDVQVILFEVERRGTGPPAEHGRGDHERRSAGDSIGRKLR